VIEIGYALSSEEHSPRELVRQAVAAGEAGFSFALVSDHYHPWTDRQGESAFVWSVIGAIGQATERLRLGTGVTCPTMRIHPAVIAIERFEQAGFDHVYVHQVGPDQDGFLRFYEREVLSGAAVG
jgi:alkanesulfonate monooxygenase SsuD/methylene tetrahydromethanopterin reductase-like flavin-dependent oxidoreductase (luciferase family)